MLAKPRLAARRLRTSRANRRLRPRSRRARTARGLARDLGGALRKLGRIGLFATTCAALGGGAWAVHRYLTHSPYFSVRALRISPTRHVTTATLAARAGVHLGVNLFAIDLDQVARRVSREPWVASARAHLELPSTVAIDVVERQPACALALGSLYLADSTGTVFKVASPEEAAALPVVTGIGRDSYLGDPQHAKIQIVEALAALRGWQARPRPRLGELHVDPVWGVTVYTLHGGIGVRLGRIDDSLPARLARFDAVFGALASAGTPPRLIYLDNRARPDRVTVKLAQAEEPAQSDQAN